eukprot:9344213-Heterocapsa_arctica.AAC.1
MLVSRDFRWKGGHNTAYDFEHMVGHNYAKTQQKPQRAPPGAPGVVVSVVLSHRFGRLCARNPLCRVMAPLKWHTALY